MMNLKNSSTETILLNDFDPASIKTDPEHTLNKEIAKLLAAQTGVTESMTETPTMVNIPSNFFWKIEDEKMNENDILKAFIEKVDRDQSELKTDIRESEKRTSEQINRVEERMDARLNRIEDAISKSIESTDGKIDDLKKMVDTKMEAVDSKMNWVVGTCVATIIGIAGMAITLFLTLRAGA